MQSQFNRKPRNRVEHTLKLKLSEKTASYKRATCFRSFTPSTATATAPWSYRGVLNSRMATQLKVEELRAELAQRRLSTTGTKPTLVSSPPSFFLLHRFDAHSSKHLSMRVTSYRSGGLRPLFAKKVGS